MQRGREGNDNFFGSGDPFGNLGGFGSHRSISSLFGGRDPFNDPFFTSPFSSPFGPSMFGTGGPSGIMSTSDAARGPVIEELNSDDERGEEEEDKNSGDEKVDPRNLSGSCIEPYVEHPDDDGGERAGKLVNNSSNHNRIEGMQPPAQSYSFRKVTHGGINGTYFTSSISRRMGSGGVIVEESKAADVTTGQAEHKISKAIHNKGHSVTRKLNPDGKVDTMQSLHNLSEDELAGFEETWKVNADKHLPGKTKGFNLQKNAGEGSSGQERQSMLGGWALPSIERAGDAGRMGPDYGARTNSSSGRAKKVVTIPID